MDAFKSFFTIKEVAAKLAKFSCTEDDVIQAGLNGQISIQAQIQEWRNQLGWFRAFDPDDRKLKIIERYCFPLAKITSDQLLRFIPGIEEAELISFDDVIDGPDGKLYAGVPTDKTGAKVHPIIVKRSNLLVHAKDLKQLVSLLERINRQEALPIEDRSKDLPCSTSLTGDETELSRKTLSKIVYLLAQELAEKRPDVFRRGQTLNKSAFARAINERAIELGISVYGLTNKTFGKVIAEIEGEKNKKKLSNSLD